MNRTPEQQADALEALVRLHRINGERGWDTGFYVPKNTSRTDGREYMPIADVLALAHVAGYSAHVRVCRRTPGMYRVSLRPYPGVGSFRRMVAKPEVTVRGD